ncbi:MAG: acetolactate synthase large subunit [Thermodesulfovibrionales bacterium]
MNVSELFVRCLEKEGVDTIFGIPGEENLPLLEALTHSSIKFITTRDERGASFMANAWGRLRKKPGVCLSTLGPGATNMMTGIADALLDFSPLVAITAQVPLSKIHEEYHQYIDVLSLMKQITKWNARIEPHSVSEIVSKAFRISMTEKWGPCHLELNEDIAESKVEGQPLEPIEYKYPEVSPELIKKAIRMLEEAHQPVIIAGNGVIRAQATQELKGFAEKAGIPVFTTFMGAGAMPADSELFISPIGLQSKDYVNCGIERADLIMAIGFDPVEFSPEFWHDAKVIHISTVPAEISSHYKVQIDLCGDIKNTLSQLAESIISTKDPYYYLRLRELSYQEFDDRGFPLKPLRIVNEIRNVLGRKDILISDVGAHKIWIGRFYRVYEPDTLIISNGLSSMGFAIPAAIVAKMLNPERNVIAAVGDGGLLMSLAELETAKRLGVKLTIVLFNDSGYGLISWKELIKYGRTFYVDFENPDFVKLAHAFGMEGYRVEKEDDLSLILRNSFGHKESVLIDCPVDYRENLKLTERLGSIICPV